jgi:PST family polysaccharide transporter
MNAYWIKFLPGFVRARLDGRHGLQAVLGNSSWLFADKVIRMGVGLLVGVWIVRYLGPSQLGLLAYAGAFTGLFGAVAALGLDRMVVQEIVKRPDRQDEILGTAFALKVAGGLAGLAITVIAISFVRTGDTLMLWLVGICAAGFVFQSLNVIDFFFQAKVQAKYAVIAANAAFFVVTLAKIAFLILHAQLIAFAWAGLGEIVLTSIFLIVAYRVNGKRMNLWRYSGTMARTLLKYSWPLILSGVAIAIYMRIDQIMIGEMLGDKEVGLFSAAVRISEIWYFIPMAIVSSLVPMLMQSKIKSEELYYDRLQKLFTMLIWLGVVAAVVMTLAKDPIIGLLFGEAYADSAKVLAIHIWGGIFVALGVGSGIWFTIENLQTYSFYRTLSGCVANVLLNFLLIPKFGINGAAVATVIAQCFAAFLFDFSNPKTRPIFWMKVKAFNPVPLLRAGIRRV